MVLHRAAGAVSKSSTIQAGDLVIVYERFDTMKSVYVNPGESYGNRYGNFKLKVGCCSLSCEDSCTLLVPEVLYFLPYRTGLENLLVVVWSHRGVEPQAGSIYWHQHQSCGQLSCATELKSYMRQTSA